MDKELDRLHFLTGTEEKIPISLNFLYDTGEKEREGKGLFVYVYAMLSVVTKGNNGALRKQKAIFRYKKKTIHHLPLLLL